MVSRTKWWTSRFWGLTCIPTSAQAVSIIQDMKGSWRSKVAEKSALSNHFNNNKKKQLKQHLAWQKKLLALNSTSRELVGCHYTKTESPKHVQCPKGSVQTNSQRSWSAELSFGNKTNLFRDPLKCKDVLFCHSKNTGTYLYSLQKHVLYIYCMQTPHT